MLLTPVQQYAKESPGGIKNTAKSDWFLCHYAMKVNAGLFFLVKFKTQLVSQMLQDEKCKSILYVRDKLY